MAYDLPTDAVNSTVNKDTHPALHDDANTAINDLDNRVGDIEAGSTTKGDLLTHSAGAITRLPIGTNGKVLTADSTQTTGMLWQNAVSTSGTRTVTNADATAVSGDLGGIIEMNNTTSHTVTIPASGTLTAAVGSEIVVRRQNIGGVTIVGGGGVTIDAPGGGLSIVHQYGSVILVKRATDEWVLDGDNGVNPALADRDNGQPGMACRTPWSSPNSFVFNNTIPANRAYFSRFVPSRQMTITKMAFVCNGLSPNDDHIDIGLYDSSLNKIVTKGSTAGQLTSTGVKVQTISSTVLTAGTVYYAAFQADIAGATGATIIGLTVVSSLTQKVFGTSAPNLEAGFGVNTMPLGASITPDTTGTPSVPLLWVQE